MDSNTKLSLVINAIGSSVRSLGSCFGLLKKKKNFGPINLLPPELMQLILTKLALDFDVKRLIRLRLVSTRWREIVEDYCARKRTLNVQQRDLDYVFEQRFFGFVKIDSFTSLFWTTTEMPSQCLRSLLQMFPNIERLSIKCKNSTQVDDFAVYINSLDSLKQLNLENLFVSVLPSQISTTLPKLEHFAFDFLHLDENEHHQLISHLSPNCGRVNLRGLTLTYNQVHQWQRINPLWLANVTHLRIGQFKNGRNDGPKLVHFLAEYATLLKHLSLDFEYLPFGLALTPAVMSEFAKMTNLVELELMPIGIDFSALEQAAEQQQIASLSSVLKCELNFTIYSRFGFISADAFTRVFSVILPNLEELNLYIGNEYVMAQIDGLFELEFGQHLYRFAKLRKHTVHIFD